MRLGCVIYLRCHSVWPASAPPQAPPGQATIVCQCITHQRYFPANKPVVNCGLSHIGPSSYCDLCCHRVRKIAEHVSLQGEPQHTTGRSLGSLYGLRVLVFSWRLRDTDGCDGWASNALPETQSLGSKLAAVASSLLISQFQNMIFHICLNTEISVLHLSTLCAAVILQARAVTPSSMKPQVCQALDIQR